MDRRTFLLLAASLGASGSAVARLPRRSRMRNERVVVVGGGIAGCAAATVLAERGVRVTLLEQEPVLGGRAGAWTDHLATGEAFEMERGFHAFFRNYHNLRRLLRRLDPSLSMLTPLEDYPLLGPDGAEESFRGLPHRAPLNILEVVRRSPAIHALDLLRADITAARAMMEFDPVATYEKFDGITARAYLDSLRFPPDARTMLFNVFAHSFFNPEEELSAAELLLMFHFYFLANAEGLVFDVMNRPFSVAWWRPWEAYLRRLGVEVQLRQRVQSVQRRGAEWTLHTARRSHAADAAVLAVTVPALKALAQQDLGDAQWRADIAQLDVTRPFAVWRLWLDRPTRPGRAPFAGTAGMGILENISLFHLFEGESRSWALRHRGSVVELHAYALPTGRTEEDVRQDLWQRCVALYPEVRGAKVLEQRFLLRQDCPSFKVNSHARRPGVETPDPTLVIAGDLVRLPVPTALMERAATSGIMAANVLLRRWRLQPEPVWSVPPRGMLAGGALDALLSRQVSSGV